MLEGNLKSIYGSWRDIADAARTTVHKEAGEGEPVPLWKKKILLAEHSPIRKLVFNFKWSNLMSWVSVHLVRHKIGIEHFVSTQRSDRTGIDRNKLPQDSLINHEISINAQAIITISRKRLCSCASKETREAWQLFLNSFKEKEPELYSVCVKECLYRGFCPEMKSCGYIDTIEAIEKLKEYRKK